MKWLDSHLVEGTDPPVRIGRPMKHDPRNGQVTTIRCYHERYTVNGKQVSRTLRTGNKKEAIRRVIERQSARRAGAVPETTPRLGVSIAEGLDTYMRVCRNRDLAPKTIEKYQLTIGDIKTAFGDRAGASADSFGEQDFWWYHAHMRERGLSDKTRYDRLNVLKQAFKYLYREGIVGRYRLDRIPLPKPEAAPQPCFTEDQVAVLLEAADDYHRPIFAMMAYTGMRFGEVRDLRWSDLLLERGKHGYVQVARGGSREKTKSKRSRFITLNPRLRCMLDALPRRGERVFHDLPSRRHPMGDGPLVERKLLMAIKALCRQCGFADPDTYRLHTFRHTFCSMCARDNVSYKYALYWLGQSDSRILDIYYTMYDATADEAMASINYCKAEDQADETGQSDVGGTDADRRSDDRATAKPMRTAS